MTTRDFKRIQNLLTESTIRGLWSSITRKHPEICLNDGIRLDFNRRFSEKCIYNVMRQLLQCSHSGKTVVTPIYSYHYEPDNDPPNHMMALTLFYDQPRRRLIMNLFNPKGRESPRKPKEVRFMRRLGHMIRHQTHIPLCVYYYNGPNIQKNDTIGLCQLYSLLYLYEFIRHPNAKGPSYTLKCLQKHIGKIDRDKLWKFWQGTLRNNIPKKSLFGSKNSRGSRKGKKRKSR